MSPLISRRPAGAVAAAPSYRWEKKAEEETSTFLEDAKLFATGWVGGLIFFGTFIG